MKFYLLIIYILIVFLKTETLLSENNLFNVNNIKLEKKGNTTNNSLANKAIKKGFNQLINKIILKEDIEKFSDLNLDSIKNLVTYYQITKLPEEKNNTEFVNFSVTFDKEKLHELFYKRGISYSEILDKELYILPILLKKNEIYVFNNNFFYQNWNEIYQDKLIEFILPLENIEIIQYINSNKNNLIKLDLDILLKEYTNKNIAFILIDDNNENKKIYLKIKIQKKNISKGIDFKKKSLKPEEIYEQIITITKKEIINLVKSVNLIDIRTPAFLNIQLILNKNTNLVEFNNRIKKIDSIENVYVQEVSKDYMNIKIKYLGKLDKIINQLKNNKIDLKFINEQWVIKNYK